MKQVKLLAVLLAVVMLAAYVSPWAVSGIKGYIFAPDENVAEGSEKESITLKKGNYVYFGSYLGEPILWKVVDSGEKLLLVSEKIICFKSFDAYGEDSEYHTTHDTEVLGSSEWEDCTLKEWLNSDEMQVSYSHCPPDSDSVFGGCNAYENEKGFLCEDNFTSEQKALISQDGVFLPGREMLKKYFNSKTLKKSCSACAITSNDSPYIVSSNQKVWYWTSTPVNHNNSGVVAVTSSGTFYKTLASDSTMGVCPALYLATDIVVSRGGSGSLSDPYIIIG